MANLGFLTLLIFLPDAELCNVYEVDKEIQIQSMNYPDDYPSNLTQCWIFDTRSPTETINIEFTYFSTEVNFDYVTLYDGSSSNASVIERLSGVNIAENYNVQSTGQYMTVTFVTDYSLQFRGFQACVCVSSAVPCSCGVVSLPLSTIIAITGAVLVVGLLVLIIGLRQLTLSTKRQVRPTTNQRRAQGQVNRRSQAVQPSVQQMPQRQPADQRNWWMPAVGQQPPLMTNGRPPANGPPPPAWQQPPLMMTVQPPPPNGPPPPAGQLAPLMRQSPPPAYSALPTGQQLPLVESEHPVADEPEQPSANFTAHEQQTLSSTSLPPPAPEGLYRNTTQEPPPAPKIILTK